MEAIIDTWLNKLTQISKQTPRLILGIKDQTDELAQELVSFKSNLNETENAEIERLVKEAEEVVDRYVAERKAHFEKGGVLKYAERVAYYRKIGDTAKEIQAIKLKVQEIRQDLCGLDKPPPALQVPVVEEHDVIGFDGEAKTIKDLLTKGSEDLAVISIVGMAGLGKTTLTKMVFNDPEIQSEFYARIWVNLSKKMNRRHIFITIISYFNKKIDDYRYMNEVQLAERIKNFLEDKKYFIVMDDVWQTEDWESLRIAFPQNNKGSRVLVTTRVQNVAEFADSSHNLKFLEPEESWELLRKNVFRKELCSPSLEPIGRSIAEKCNGLPLAVAVIAGALDKDSTAAEWKTVAEDPFLDINREDPSYNKLLKLSYDHLPSHAKDCFLYLAVFPLGHEISAWKLIRLWVAEGFIPSNLESTAESCLNDFVNRNLLMVLRRRSNGGIKTCRIHDALYEFYKSEALSKNLFLEIDGEASKIDISGYDRLCLRSSPMDFITSETKPAGEHIRSFTVSTSSCPTKVVVPKVNLAAIPKSYPLLKVFDVEPLIYELLPKELYQSYHLRYLAVSTDLKIFPKLFIDLWNMQTLLFYTSYHTIDVRAEIWNMPKLRHLISKAPLQIPPPPQANENSSPLELQTLFPVLPKSCTSELFDRTQNLLKLGVRGNLAELLESNEGICLFDNIQRLNKLESLKLEHVLGKDQDLTPQIFPRVDKFPRNLRKLTLSKTSFGWSDICALGSLDELEILKLDESAAMGDSWELNDVVFKRLQFLRIGKSDLVKWTCKKSSFPALKSLYLSHCTELVEVPLAFKDVESLKIMNLVCTEKAIASAQEIRAQRPENSGFNLNICHFFH